MRHPITIIGPFESSINCGISRFSEEIFEEMRINLKNVHLLKFKAAFRLFDVSHLHILNYPGKGFYFNKALLISIFIYWIRGGKLILINHELPKNRTEKVLHFFLYYISKRIVSPQRIKFSAVERFLFLDKKYKSIPNFSLIRSDVKTHPNHNFVSHKQCCSFGILHKGKNLEYLLEFAEKNQLEYSIVGRFEEPQYQSLIENLIESSGINAFLYGFLDDRSLMEVLFNHDFAIFYGERSSLNWSTTIKTCIDIKMPVLLITENEINLIRNMEIFKFEFQKQSIFQFDKIDVSKSHKLSLMSRENYVRLLFKDF